MTENQYVKLSAALNNSFRMPEHLIEFLDTYQLKRWSKSYLLDVIIWRQDGTGVIPFGDKNCYTARLLDSKGNSYFVTKLGIEHQEITCSECSQFFVSFRSYGAQRVALIKPATY